MYSPPKPGFDPFNGLLPGAPSALREFPNHSEIAAAFEVYVNKPTPVHHFDVTTTVKADDGRVVFNHSAERSTEELHGTPGGFGFTTRIPIQNWAPGLYVLEIAGEVAPQRRRACIAHHSVRGEIDGCLCLRTQSTQRETENTEEF